MADPGGPWNPPARAGQSQGWDGGAVKPKPQTRGARITRLGFRMVWAFVILLFPVGLILGALNAPRAVVIWVLVLLFADAFTGLGVVLYGNHINDQELDGYLRKIEEGEIRPVPPSGAAPHHDSRDSVPAGLGRGRAEEPPIAGQRPQPGQYEPRRASIQQDLAGAADRQRRAEAGEMRRAAKSWTLQEMALVTVGCLFFWPALFFFIVAAGQGSHWWEWLGGAVCTALMIGPWVAAARLVRADRHARRARATKTTAAPGQGSQQQGLLS